MHFKKAQTAVELLGVYGWVILLILLILVIVYYSGYLSFETLFPPYCTFTATMSCRTYRFGYTPDGRNMVLTFKLVNGLGYDILLGNNNSVLTVENVGKPGRNQYNMTCRPTNVPIRQGNIISCVMFIPDMISVPTVGRNVNFQLQTTYLNCNEGPNYTASGNCSGAPSFMVAGNIRTPMEPSTPQLWSCGSGFCDYMLGETPSNCCSDCVVYLTLTANPPVINTSQFTTLIVNTTYPDGTPAANATVYFAKRGGWDPNNNDDLEVTNVSTNSTITDANGIATANYSSNIPGPMTLIASSCGPAATANVTVIVGAAPLNGTILFNYSPQYQVPGGNFDVNMTVYNSSGNPVPSTPLVLSADPDSSVSQNNLVTDSSGMAEVNFTSTVSHPGRLTAKATSLNIWNSTLLTFEPYSGTISMTNDGPGNVSSEGFVDIYGCVSDLYGNPVNNVNVAITTDWGYFNSTAGTPKLPGLTSFTSERPTVLYYARTFSGANGGAGFRAFGYNYTCNGYGRNWETADPVELDAYAGKFVKIMATRDKYANSSTKASTIASYLSMVGTNGRTVYIFYNPAYNMSDGSETGSGYGGPWLVPALFYANLTAALQAVGINPCVGLGRNCFQTVSNAPQLKSLMLNNANTTILISANGMLPVEVWQCETDGGVPKKFFQRGGIQIHTGDFEYYYGLNSSGGDSNRLYTCNKAPPDYMGDDGSKYVFGYFTSTTWCDPNKVSPIMESSTTTATTYGPNGCFSTSTDHPLLVSGAVGTANVNATYKAAYGSTTVTFGAKQCLNAGVGYVNNGGCFSQGNKPDFCINGFDVNRCYICYPDCGGGTNVCNPISGDCVPKPGPLNLTIKTFNGTGVQLPNDNFTMMEIIAQVLDQNGIPQPGYNIIWTPNNVLINQVLCPSTQNNCGDYSALNQPGDPREAVFINSNGSWTGVANVTAAYIDFNGNNVNVTVSIPVYQVFTNRTVGGVRWRKVDTTLLPADGYTNTSVCVASFNLNDSAVGNVSICLNTSLGTFTNGMSMICTSDRGGQMSTDQYGEVCSSLKSNTWGNANVSAIVGNETSPGVFTNVTYYLPNNVTFYQLPTTILISASPNPTTPCSTTYYSKCSSSSTMTITATFLNSSGAPISGIPYTYFYMPRATVNGCGSTRPNALVWGDGGFADSCWWGSAWERLLPSYVDMRSQCTDATKTNGFCSSATDSNGNVSTTFHPIYPPGDYNISVGTFYYCNSTLYSPTNCMYSISNSSMLNISMPQTLIVTPPSRTVKADYSDSINITFTMYDATGSPLEGVFFRGTISPCNSTNCPTYVDSDGNSYNLDGDSTSNPYLWFTNATGQGNSSGIRSNVSGTYTLTFSTYYVIGNQWFTLLNSTQVNFLPVANNIIVNASPTWAYADGRTYSNVTFTVLDSNGNPMYNSLVYINPPSIGGVSCCGSTGCSCKGYTVNGNFSTLVYSNDVTGISNVSAYILYAGSGAFQQITNYTNVTFKPRASIVVMSSNSSNISADGVSTVNITAQFTDSSGTPTPGIGVQCNVSNDIGVLYPPDKTVMQTDSNGNVSVYMSALYDPGGATVDCFYSYLGGSVIGSKNIILNSTSEAGVYDINFTTDKISTPAGSYINVTANVTNATTLLPAPINTPVVFSTSYAGIFQGSQNTVTAYTDANGLASVKVTAIGPGKIYVNANSKGDWKAVKLTYT